MTANKNGTALAFRACGLNRLSQFTGRTELCAGILTLHSPDRRVSNGPILSRRACQKPPGNGRVMARRLCRNAGFRGLPNIDR
jgi:hypothetical protein